MSGWRGPRDERGGKHIAVHGPRQHRTSGGIERRPKNGQIVAGEEQLHRRRTIQRGTERGMSVER
jgi:hypothetical protein